MRARTALVAAAVCAALVGTATVASAQITIGVSVHTAPPVLPVYTQPDMPAPGYLWVPGYWAWSDEADYYYWVPGTWVLPPEAGLLWTPGYWGWTDDVYVWHEGYWGTHVGFYGGVDYGFGYGPHGYDGGYWNHGRFYYNTAVTRVGPGVHLAYTYNHPVPRGAAPGHASFNGGHGGVQVRPSAAQLSAAREHHVMPISAQRDLVNSASHDRQLRANFNHGHPAVLATPRPEVLARPGGEAARLPEHGIHAAGGAGPSREARPVPGHPAERSFAPAGSVSRGPANEPRALGNEPRVPTSQPRFPTAEPRVPTSQPRIPAAEPHAQNGFHGAPSFTPREHVPAVPRGETHAAPAGNPHAGAAHPAEPRAGGGARGEDRQHPPQR
ncbi:MAG TPA: hypothetical protein VID71_01625 [Steroidobacteraceae bacterium]|jgi:hypothetical protein